MEGRVEMAGGERGGDEMGVEGPGQVDLGRVTLG